MKPAGRNKLGCFSPDLVEYLVRAVTGTGTMSCLATSGLPMAKAAAQVLQTSIICPGLWPDQNWSVGVSPEPTALSSNLSPSSTASPYSSSELPQDIMKGPQEICESGGSHETETESQALVFDKHK